MANSSDSNDTTPKVESGTQASNNNDTNDSTEQSKPRARVLGGRRMTRRGFGSRTKSTAAEPASTPPTSAPAKPAPAKPAPAKSAPAAPARQRQRAAAKPSPSRSEASEKPPARSHSRVNSRPTNSRHSGGHQTHVAGGRPNTRQGSAPQRKPFNKTSNNSQGNFNRRNGKYRESGISDEVLLREELERTREGAETIDIHVLKSKKAGQLSKVAKEYGIDTYRADKSELIFSLLTMHAEKGDILYASNGVLEILPDGFGFLRCIESSYLAGPDDVYVSPSQIDRHHLKTGDMISGRVRAPRDDERYFAILKVDEINYDKPGSLEDKIPFGNLTPLFPTEMLKLEMGNGTSEDLAPRVVQAFCPIGKGQRGLIVSPPKAGKTMMLQSLAHSISANHPECHLIVLLIDERPEEVTDMQRSVKGEVVASTFDEPASRHVQVAEMVMERARRLVEHKRDVVVLLDSITRLARAYNTVIPSSGKVLTGGVDANALQRPKRILGAARNVEEGGSLTIIATALVDTGSKMDEVLFEEFKGTGNMEVHLDRRIAEKRIFPAININRSGTRREELMMTPEELRRTWIIRKVLHPMDEISASEFLLERMHQVRTNAEFFETMRDSKP